MILIMLEASLLELPAGGATHPMPPCSMAPGATMRARSLTCSKKRPARAAIRHTTLVWHRRSTDHLAMAQLRAMRRRTQAPRTEAAVLPNTVSRCSNSERRNADPSADGDKNTCRTDKLRGRAEPESTDVIDTSWAIVAVIAAQTEMMPAYQPRTIVSTCSTPGERLIRNDRLRITNRRRDQ